MENTKVYLCKGMSILIRKISLEAIDSTSKIPREDLFDIMTVGLKRDRKAYLHNHSSGIDHVKQ